MHAATLPELSADERALSAQLESLIDSEITRAGGVIPFARYMELVLYAPGIGYYSGELRKFGAEGDFVTAPELGPVFAHCLARQCAQVLAMVGGDILEAGAGSGALAAELLLELEQLGQLPERYRILELSADLRARQAELIRSRAPHLFDRVAWLDVLPETVRGVVLGNELLDAMPVEKFRMTRDGLRRLGVGRDDSGYVWRELPADAALAARLAPLALAEGYESEVGLAAEGWVRSLAERLEAGAMLLVDYGFPRAEFYHPDRRGGTLMCHHRHRAHDNPLVLTGLQDITAHIDFTAIAEAGVEAGLDLLGYTAQAPFLIGCGLDEIVLHAPDDVRLRLTQANEIKKLTLPHEMGELFKVIALGRGIVEPLRGFIMQDRRGRL